MPHAWRDRLPVSQPALISPSLVACVAVWGPGRAGVSPVSVLQARCDTGSPISGDIHHSGNQWGVNAGATRSHTSWRICTPSMPALPGVSFAGSHLRCEGWRTWQQRGRQGHSGRNRDNAEMAQEMSGCAHTPQAGPALPPSSPHLITSNTHLPHCQNFRPNRTEVAVISNKLRWPGSGGGCVGGDVYRAVIPGSGRCIDHQWWMGAQVSRAVPGWVCGRDWIQPLPPSLPLCQGGWTLSQSPGGGGGLCRQQPWWAGSIQDTQWTLCPDNGADLPDGTLFCECVCRSHIYNRAINKGPRNPSTVLAALCVCAVCARLCHMSGALCGSLPAADWQMAPITPTSEETCSLPRHAALWQLSHRPPTCCHVGHAGWQGALCVYQQPFRCWLTHTHTHTHMHAHTHSAQLFESPSSLMWCWGNGF